MSVNQFTKVCAGCEVEMRLKKNGVLLVEAATFGFLTLRHADLWHCPVCGVEIVIGAGEQLFGHWEGNIVDEIKRRETRGQKVITCWINDREKNEFIRRGREAEAKKKVGL